jgi:hypothetical protein
MRDTRRSGAGEGMIGRREGGGGRWEVRWCWWEGKEAAARWRRAWKRLAGGEAMGQHGVGLGGLG